MSSLHLSDILRAGFYDYSQSHSMCWQQRKVIRDIVACRTGLLGYQRWQCNQCSHETKIGSSCRDRHCPRCQGKVTQQWVEQQQQNVLSGDYFHLVFTLPHELNPLAQYRPKLVYTILFQSVWETLQAFTVRRFGQRSQLGMLSVLHTWGQNLNQHIHLHCLVPGGVLDHQAHWHANNKRYLYPVKALSTVFRAKVLSHLDTAHVDIRSLNLPKTWCVYSKPTLQHANSVLKYLARYTRKGMMAESRLVSHCNEQVTFRYKDYRDNKNKVMTLTTMEFIRRYLLHVLPKGFMRIRYYGFLANACRKKKVALIQQQQCSRPVTVKQSENSENTWPCQACDKGVLQLVAIEPALLSSVKRMVPT